MDHSMFRSLSLVVALAAVATAYNLETLETYRVSQIKAQTVKAGLPSDLMEVKAVCSKLAVGIFDLLGVDEDLSREGFPVDAALLFDDLNLWALAAPKPTLVPTLPESRWDLSKLERYTLSNVMKASNNPNAHKQCMDFTDRIFLNYGEVYNANDPKLNELSLELVLQLAKFYGDIQTSSQVIANVKALAQKCSLVLAAVLKRQNEGLTKDQVDDTTQSLIRLVDPNWRPKEY